MKPKNSHILRFVWYFGPSVFPYSAKQPGSALNRSKSSESIIGEVFDSIIDFKSIFKPDLSNEISHANGFGSPLTPLPQIMWNMLCMDMRVPKKAGHP